MPGRNLRLAAITAASLASAGCETWYNRVPSPDDLMHNIPWFDHMIVQRSVHPYSRVDVPRYTPMNSIPVSGGEADWAAEFRSGTTTTADRLVNPLRSGAAAPAPGAAVPAVNAMPEAEGDTTFHTYCAVCHGPAGDGRGLVQVGAPSLLTARARGFSDGYLYSIIRYGRGVMPRYGDKIFRPADRWAVVNYVRSVQASAPAPEPAPGTPPASGAAPGAPR